jgi:hypothetical protein
VRALIGWSSGKDKAWRRRKNHGRWQRVESAAAIAVDFADVWAGKPVPDTFIFLSRGLTVIVGYGRIVAVIGGRNIMNLSQPHRPYGARRN